MDEQRLAQRLRALSQTELFYRDYRLAKSSPAGFQVYLEQLNPSFVRASGLVIPEWPDTAARERPEEQYFPPDGRAGLRVRTNAFPPRWPTATIILKCSMCGRAAAFARCGPIPRCCPGGMCACCSRGWSIPWM